MKPLLARLDANLFAILVTLAIVASALVWAWPPNREKGPRADSRLNDIVLRGKTEYPIVVGSFHGDVRMPEIQRQTVEDAVKDIERTSCGLVKLSIVWDFDPDTEMVYRVIKGDNILMTVRTRDIVRFMGKTEGEKLAGLTRYTNSRWIFLVEDKLDAKLEWEWVAAHEMTHALGLLDHVSEGLMAEEMPLVIDDKPSWQYNDLKLFCSAYGCLPEMFMACRDR